MAVPVVAVRLGRVAPCRAVGPAHTSTMSDDDEKQVSEVSQMTPNGGAGTAPGTDDGIPPAEDAQSEADGAPRDYRADKTASPQSPPQADPKELG